MQDQRLQPNELDPTADAAKMRPVDEHRRRGKAHPAWHVLGGVLVSAWLLVLGLMFWPQSQAAETISTRSIHTGRLLLNQDEWMGVYYYTRKIGYVHSVTEPKPEGGSRLTQDSHWALELGGIQQAIDSKLELSLDKEGRLERFSVRFEAGPWRLAALGSLEAGRLSFEVRMGSETWQRTLVLDEPPLFELALPRLLSGLDLVPGKRYRVLVFDPQTLSNQPMEISVIGLEAFNQGSKLVAAMHLTRQLNQIKVDSWIDDQGRLLKEENALGLSMRREEEKDATLLDGSGRMSPGLDGSKLLQQLLPQVPLQGPKP